MEQTPLDEVRQVLKKAADSLNLQFIDAKVITDKENGPTLEIFVDKDYAITLDEISKYTDVVTPLLDKMGGITDTYMLDISSGGSDREIPESDVSKLIGHYLDITLKKGDEKITAKVLDASTDGFTALYFIKGRKKQVSLKFADIKLLKMGYKA
jgi:ribosome maturation factor RimP